MLIDGNPTTSKQSLNLVCFGNGFSFTAEETGHAVQLPWMKEGLAASLVLAVPSLAQPMGVSYKAAVLFPTLEHNSDPEYRTPCCAAVPLLARTARQGEGTSQSHHYCGRPLLGAASFCGRLGLGSCLDSTLQISNFYTLFLSH
jgi:hypothetical protein